MMDIKKPLIISFLIFLMIYFIIGILIQPKENKYMPSKTDYFKDKDGNIQTYQVYPKTINEREFNDMKLWLLVGATTIIFVVLFIWQEKYVYIRRYPIVLDSLDPEDKEAVHAQNPFLLYFDFQISLHNGRTSLRRYWCSIRKCYTPHHTYLILASDNRIEADQFPRASPLIGFHNGYLTKETAKTWLDQPSKELIDYLIKFEEEAKKTTNPEAIKRLLYEKKLMEEQRGGDEKDE